jgi:hypothetical protein
MAKADKKQSKGKGKGKGAAEGGIRLAAHPRARRDIGLAKGWGGLGAFGIMLVLSLQGDVPTADALLRALLAGMVGYVVGWCLAVLVWRHVALAEIEVATQRLRTAQADVERDAALAAMNTGNRA